MVIRIRWQRPAPAFYYPIETTPRTAVHRSHVTALGGPIPVFLGAAGTKTFGDSLLKSLRRHSPNSVSRWLAPGFHRCVMPSVLTRQGDSWLTEAGRERFWSAFRVPIFEQIIGNRGELLATDCEAHGGLHIESSKPAIDKRISILPIARAAARRLPGFLAANGVGLSCGGIRALKLLYGNDKARSIR